jgi:hypothetical protein
VWRGAEAEVMEQKHGHAGRKRYSNSIGEGTGFFADQQVQASGSIFQHRKDLAAFYAVLPKWKVNGFHIKLEDDCPQGNDDTRIFLLTNLGDNNIRTMDCLLCRASLSIYDKYPLIDGTFFISPVKHGIGRPVRYDSRDSYLLAICMQCLEDASNRLVCLRCGGTGWFLGSHIILGGLYGYDILSASPCCPPECRKCGHRLPMPDPHRCLSNFSVYSEPSVCSNCGSKDYHYIRRMDSVRLVQERETGLSFEVDSERQIDPPPGFDCSNAEHDNNNSNGFAIESALGQSLLRAVKSGSAANNFRLSPVALMQTA